MNCAALKQVEHIRTYIRRTDCIRSHVGLPASNSYLKLGLCRPLRNQRLHVRVWDPVTGALVRVQ